MRLFKHISVVVCILIIAHAITPHAFSQSQDDTCVITWDAGDAARILHNGKEVQSCTVEMEKGHVISHDDLPIVESDFSSSDKYHSEWTGAVGTEVTQDMEFRLNWVSSVDGYRTVIWKTDLPGQVGNVTEDDDYPCYYFDRKFIDIYPVGYVITEKDMYRDDMYYDFFYYEEPNTDMPFYFEWQEGTKGTVIENDNTVFVLECHAKAENHSVVIWYCEYYTVEITKVIDGEQVYGMVGIIEVYPNGHVITKEDLPHVEPWTYDSSMFMHDYVWDESTVGTRIEGRHNFYVREVPMTEVTVEFYRDGEVCAVYEDIPVGEVIKMPDEKILTDSDGVKVAWWWGSCYAGDTDRLRPGEEFAVSFDWDFEVQCAVIGDSNIDFTTNTNDAVCILRHVVGLREILPLGEVGADMNDDGVINTSDAVGVLKYIIAQDGK